MASPDTSPVDSPARVLTPDELQNEFVALIKEFGTDLENDLGIEIVFPAGTVLGDIDISGKSVPEVLRMLSAKIETYEPPITREADEHTEEENMSVPLWLKGHEDLIWRGATENPMWEVQEKQYGNDVTVAYMRRNRLLKPGKTRMEQGRTLEPIHHSFTVPEWKVLKYVLDDYRKMESHLKSAGEVREKARKEMRAIIKEENAYRHGRSEGEGVVPQRLKEKVQEAVARVGAATRGFKPDSVDVDTLTQHAAEILSQLIVLNRSRGDGRERVPTPKKDIKEIPSFIRNLSELARCLDMQHTSQKGLTLMIGEAGTGKNEAAEYVSANTNRPYFWFPCGRGMEAAEMVTHYEFDSREGTQRFLTALAEGIQTPGAVVMIDEVNALKPEVQAILHGLGDSNRALNFDGIYIPVAEDVLIIIAGNPATYGSAGDLGQALLSRTRGQSMVMDYPALRTGELKARTEGWSKDELTLQETTNNNLRDYACDEVLILYPFFNEFSGLSDEDFGLLWDCFINESTQGAKRTELEKNPLLKKLIEEEHIQKTLIDLRDILEIADSWRKYYEQRQGGFDLIGMSMRDTLAIARQYKETRDVRKAFLTVFDDFRKNPIDGTDSVYNALEQLINDKVKASS